MDLLWLLLKCNQNNAEGRSEEAVRSFSPGLIVKAAVTAAEALAPGLFWLRDVRETLSKPHFIFSE